MTGFAMSQPRSSSETALPAVTEVDARRQLDRYLNDHMRPTLFGQLALRLQDPFTGQNGFRLNPFWIGMATIGALAASVFLYFNFMRA